MHLNLIKIKRICDSRILVNYIVNQLQFSHSGKNETNIINLALSKYRQLWCYWHTLLYGEALLYHQSYKPYKTSIRREESEIETHIIPEIPITLINRNTSVKQFQCGLHFHWETEHCVILASDGSRRLSIMSLLHDMCKECRRVMYTYSRQYIYIYLRE